MVSRPFNLDMAFDGICVSALTRELNNVLKDGRINKIAQPEADELIFTIKTISGQVRLFISADASLPLIYLTENNKPSPMQAPGFCMLLRKHLSTGRIVAVRQPSLERIIMFDIEHLNELGDVCQKTLVVELMGKHSNVIFCDENGMIIDSIKHVSALVSSVREVLPGRQYFIPNTMEKISPLEEMSFDMFAESVFSKSMTISKAIYTQYIGISPQISHEICYRAGVDGDAPTAAINDNEKQQIYNQYVYLINDIKNGSYAPEIVYTDEETPRDFSMVHMKMFEDYTRKEYDSPSVLLENYYSQKNAATRIRQKSADLRRVVVSAIDRSAKKYDIQRKQLESTEKMDKFRVWGELINAYGYNVPEGAKEFEALNYYTNEMVMVPLDPMYSASENSRKYFDKYQKLKRTKEAVSEMLENTNNELLHLKSILTSLDIAKREEDLTEIRMELELAGYIKKHVATKGKGKKVKITSKPFHYESSDGFDIYVGKNNLQNDELTFKFANSGDWWFHAKKMAGSHVVLKLKDNKDVPDRTFEEAAALAAYYSSGKDQTQVEIDYLNRKDVKKPNGAKPGYVVYYTNYSMSIKPDIASLKLISD